MKVRLLKDVKVKNFQYEYGKEYDVEDGLGDWMIDHLIADKQIGLALTKKADIVAGLSDKEIVERITKAITELQSLRDELLS
jgi:hypothetical protein